MVCAQLLTSAHKNERVEAWHRYLLPVMRDVLYVCAECFRLICADVLWLGSVWILG